MDGEKKQVCHTDSDMHNLYCKLGHPKTQKGECIMRKDDKDSSDIGCNVRYDSGNSKYGICC